MAAPTPSLPILHRGRQNDPAAVKAWQLFLNSQGANLKVDGVFGKNTEAATRRIQAKIGTKADGVVGPKTWAATEATAKGPPDAQGVPFPANATGQAVPRETIPSPDVLASAPKLASAGPDLANLTPATWESVQPPPPNLAINPLAGPMLPPGAGTSGMPAGPPMIGGQPQSPPMPPMMPATWTGRPPMPKSSYDGLALNPLGPAGGLPGGAVMPPIGDPNTAVPMPQGDGMPHGGQGGPPGSPVPDFLQNAPAVPPQAEQAVISVILGQPSPTLGMMRPEVLEAARQALLKKLTLLGQQMQ